MPGWSHSRRSRMVGPLNFVVAAALSAVLTEASKPIARVIGAESLPRNDRWHRSGPVPLLGGPAILIAVLPFVEVDRLLALASFCIIGLADDLHPMKPQTKALLLIIPCGFSAWLLDNVWLVPACWIVANAMNLLDHADGLVASTCMASLLVAGDLFALIGAGVCFGFLLHNWAPARVFLGDSGSLMLGAMLVFAWAESGPVLAVTGCAVPLLESIFVVTRRVLTGTPPWQGGTDHSGHNLLRMGISPRVLPICYGAAAMTVAYAGKLVT